MENRTKVLGYSCGQPDLRDEDTGRERFLRGLGRNDEPPAEDVQRSLDVSDMRVMVEVEQTLNASFAPSDPLGQSSDADFLFPHRLVQGELCGNERRKSDEMTTAGR